MMGKIVMLIIFGLGMTACGVWPAKNVDPAETAQSQAVIVSETELAIPSRTATSEPTSTATQTPTNTPEPTSTFTVTPTPTATPDPKMIAEDLGFYQEGRDYQIVEKDGTKYILDTYSGGYRAVQEDGEWRETTANERWMEVLTKPHMIQEFVPGTDEWSEINGYGFYTGLQPSKSGAYRVRFRPVFLGDTGETLIENFNYNGNDTVTGKTLKVAILDHNGEVIEFQVLGGSDDLQSVIRWFDQKGVNYGTGPSYPGSFEDLVNSIKPGQQLDVWVMLRQPKYSDPAMVCYEATDFCMDLYIALQREWFQHQEEIQDFIRKVRYGEKFSEAEKEEVKSLVLPPVILGYLYAPGE